MFLFSAGKVVITDSPALFTPQTVLVDLGYYKIILLWKHGQFLSGQERVELWEGAYARETIYWT